MKINSLMFGACIIAVCFYAHSAVSKDSITLTCDPSVPRGVIVLDNPPKINCEDLSLIDMFVGSGLEFGPFGDMEKLAEQIATINLPPPQVYEVPSKTKFEIRRDKAFQELEDYNATIRSQAPGLEQVLVTKPRAQITFKELDENWNTTAGNSHPDPKKGLIK